jgi:hypothetical protein
MSLLPLAHGRHFSYSHREFDVALGTKTCGVTSGSGVRNCSRQGSVAMSHRGQEKAFLRASLSRGNDVKFGRGVKLCAQTKLIISSVVHVKCGGVSEQEKVAVCR